MEPMDTSGWWACTGCGVDAEIDPEIDPEIDGTPAQAVIAGCAVPCPDCGEPMVERRSWEVAA